MSQVKRYWFPITMLIIFLVLLLVNHELGNQALITTGSTIKEIALIIPPVFVLLGLMDVWVPKEIMVKYMGEGSGFKGIILAFVVGSAAAGPLYGAFPIAAVMMSKGAKFSNILIFIGAWSTTKIPMLLFEAAALGTKFALTRLLLDIPGIVLMAYFLNSLVNKEELDKIYSQA